jgi:hypothetical protein
MPEGGTMKRTFGRVAAVGFGAAVIGLVLTPAALGAKKVTIGSDLKGAADPGTGFGCGIVVDSCAIQQLKLGNNPFKTKAPFKGTIRKWRFRSVVGPNPDPYKLRLRVVRRAGPGEFEFIRRSKPGLVDEVGRLAFKTRLRVRRGDFIALELPSDEQANVNGISVVNPGSRTAEWFPAPKNGNGGVPDELNAVNEYFYNATIRKKRRR